MRNKKQYQNYSCDKILKSIYMASIKIYTYAPYSCNYIKINMSSTSEIQWLLMAAQHRLARVGFWEASQGSEGFLEGSLDVLLTSVGAAVIKGHVSLCFKIHVQRCHVFVKIAN